MFGLSAQTIFETQPFDRRAPEEAWTGPEPLCADVASSGLVAGTLIATAMGWRPAEAIAPGDLLLTFDRGLRPVKSVQRSIAWFGPDATHEHHWPLAVPAHAIGNAEPMLLLPDQPIILESDIAEAVFGDPFTLLQGRFLDGFRGIQRVAPQSAAEVIVLHFDHDEAIFAQNGALIYCSQDSLLTFDDDDTGYRSLDAEAAADLLDCIAMEDDWATKTPEQAAYAAFA